MMIDSWCVVGWLDMHPAGTCIITFTVCVGYSIVSRPFHGSGDEAVVLEFFLQCLPCKKYSPTKLGILLNFH